MSLLDYFRSRLRPTSAQAAKERLQIIVAHERGGNNDEPDYLPAMRKDILEVISRYIAIEQDQVNVHFDDSSDCSILELNIALPESPTRISTTPPVVAAETNES